MISAHSKKSIIQILFYLFATTGALMTPPFKNNIRVELFFRSDNELRDRVHFLSKKGVNAFNLVNKSNKDNILNWTKIIREELKSADICSHYSLKYNKCRKKDGAFTLFSDFVDDINSEDPSSGKNEILVVNGSGPKGKFDSVSALGRMGQTCTNTIMAVAYNPFFPSEDDLEIEKSRLVEKLASGKVGKIYLQFGTDLERLRSSLEWLSDIQEENNNFSICGSIFLPTKKLIAQQKFRPWNGVFLSEEFLNSEESARGIVLQMMRMYENYGCEILIEAPGVRNEKDMDVVEALLHDRDEKIDKTSMSGFYGEAITASSTDNNTNSKRRRIDKFVRSPSVSLECLRKPAILLFGSHDLRLHDNIALQLSSFHSSVVPAFVWSRKEQGRWGVVGAAEVVLKSGLNNLNAKLESKGLRLICRMADDSTEELKRLCEECGASAVYLNKEHTPESRLREASHKRVLENIGVKSVICQSSLLYDPASPSLVTGFHGGHWGTLMPFLRGCKKQIGEPRRPIPRHETFAIIEEMKGPESWPKSTPVGDLDLAIIQGSERWDSPILEVFPISEEDAVSNLNTFFREGFHKYENQRSRADIKWSTSKLSVHLRLGTLSPNELYYKVEDSDLDYEDKKTFSRRLIWRDLAYFHLMSFPQMREKSIRTHYEEMKWVEGEEEERRLQAWKTGKTGYPLVDAGMRELYATGWMTQSVRMVVASFLTEYLRVNWVKGCEWFAYTLVDADSAINAMMWQNAGRSGIDQWNFVMSPEAASQDSTGSYTKRWVPEVSKLSKPLIHKPWQAPESVLKEAGIVLGETYPHRIVVNLKEERQKTAENVLAMRRANQQFNNNRGYDLIRLPDGKETVVFTKKEFRIDRGGEVLKMNSQRKKPARRKSNVADRTRRGRGRTAASKAAKK